MARTKRHIGSACQWSEDSDGIWQTECGGVFVFTDAGPVENGFKFCCYCALKIKAASQSAERAAHVIPLVLLVLLLALPAAAQPVTGDRLVQPWPLEHRHAAAVLSNVTLFTAIGLDTVASWQADDRRHAFVKQGERLGAVALATWLTKTIVHRDRPCAPSCGAEQPRASFFSGHTAFTAQAIGGPRLEVSLPLTVGTGYFRVAAGKHWATDTVIGALVGAAAGRWIR